LNIEISSLESQQEKDVGERWSGMKGENGEVEKRKDNK
jgi:hypothetical protein